MNMKFFMLCLFLAMLLMSATARPVTDQQLSNEETNVPGSAADQEWKQVMAKCESGICRMALMSATERPVTNLQPFKGGFILPSATDQQLKTSTDGTSCKKWCFLIGFVPYCCEWGFNPEDMEVPKK